MRRLFTIFVAVFFASTALAAPTEYRTKNVATRVCGTIYNATTAVRIGAAVTGIDCEYAQVLDGTSESAFSDLSTTEVVVGSAGQFCAPITAGEINIDGDLRIYCSATNTNAAAWEITLTTRGEKVETGGIVAASFGSGAIDATAIAADAIGASELAADAIGASELATAAIGAAEIAADAITSSELADDALAKTKFAADGTAQGGSATTIQLAAAEAYADNVLKNRAVFIVSGTGMGEHACAKSNVGATDTVTVEAWSGPGTAPDNTSKYVVGGECSEAAWDALRANHSTSSSFGQGLASVQGNVTGSVGSVTGAVGSVTGAVGSVTGNVGGNVVGTVASVVGAVGSVTGNVGGNVTGSVGSVTGNVGGNVVGSVASVAGNVAGNVTGSVGSVTAGVTVATNNDKTNYGTSSTSISAIADQVWDELRADHVGAGSFGSGVIVSSNSDKTGYSISGTKTTLDALNDLSSANVTTALNTYDAPTKAEMDAAFTEIKGVGWNSTDDTLRQISLGGGGGGGGGGDCANVDEIADAVWDELLAGHVTTGSASEIVTTALNTTLTCEARRE